MEFGVYSSKDVDKGTTANLRIDLCTGSSGTNIDNLSSVYALMSEYVVIGAGKTNEAMIQPASGKATFYATIADAVAACEEGGTVKLCNNIDSTDTITISKAVTIDTNGMEFKGTFEPGKTYEMEVKETVLDVEKAIGKKHIAYTFTLKAVPVLPTAKQDTTIAVDGCDLAVKYTLGAAAIGYDDWNVDFVVESDKTLSGEEITLKGSNPMEGNQMVAFPGFSLEAGVPVKLLASQGISITYADLIAATEGEYTCGVINNTDKQANVTVKIILSKEDEADIVVEGSVFKGTMAKDYGIVFNDDDTALSITGEGSADVAPTFTIKQKRSVEEAVVRDGVKTIGKRFFKDFTKLSKVTVGKDVTTIGEKAFYKCMSLEKIVIDNPDFDINQLSKAVVYQLMLGEDGKLYPYPSIQAAGYEEVLYGKNDLSGEWKKIEDWDRETPMQSTGYRFFQIRVQKK